MRFGAPRGWSIARRWGPRPFVTRALLRNEEGLEVEWTSRRQRKHLGLRPPESRPGPLRGFNPRQANAMSWWIGGLFMVGSFCFGLGSLPLYFDNVSEGLATATFFVGSVFFTSAAYLQFQEANSAVPVVLPATEESAGILGSLNLDAHRIDWWATTIQLIGTIMFNVSTFSGMLTTLSEDQLRLFVWLPNVLGSVCFLVASLFAYSEVVSGSWWTPQRDIGWSISAVNLLGSVAFGIAAVAARYLPNTSNIANVAVVNSGTFAGAVCFLLGGALLPVESATESAPGGTESRSLLAAS